MESCLYEGWVRHRRYGPIASAFRFPLAMLYLDLDELDDVFRGRWLWSARRPALAWFRRADHLGDADVPLGRVVRDLVEARTGFRPAGPVRLLTHPRYAGYVFNPLSLYYCVAPDRAGLDSVVADVTNTPWGERHQYVLGPAGDPAGAKGRAWRHAKTFHVSPFLPMTLDYDWHVSQPGARLGVHIAARPGGVSRAAEAPVFDATLALRRRPLHARELRRVLVRFPLLTLQIVAGIYAQAARLWWSGVPLHSHPTASPGSGGAR